MAHFLRQYLKSFFGIVTQAHQLKKAALAECVAQSVCPMAEAKFF